MNFVNPMILNMVERAQVLVFRKDRKILIDIQVLYTVKANS